MRPRFAATLICWLYCSAACAIVPADLISSCNSTAIATTLSQASTPDLGAQAVWLSEKLLVWPGQLGSGRYRLYHSARATLDARVSATVSGADGYLRLRALPSVPAADRALETRYLGEAVEFSLPALGRAALRRLLKQQLLLVREDADGRVLAMTRPQLALVLDMLYATADDVALGGRVDAGKRRYALWAPTARRVSVCLYPDGNSAAVAAVQLKENPQTGAWSGRQPLVLSGLNYYLYLVDVVVPGVGLVRNRVTDPYSVSLSLNSQRSFLASLDDTQLTPLGWNTAPAAPPRAAATDSVIYELHVRDFSINDPSVPAAHRGKFLAFTDLNSRGMQYLRDLAQAGITDLHLLPVFDFATVPERGCITPTVNAHGDDDSAAKAVIATAATDCFNWGYDPLHFSAPEGSYASDAADASVRVREFRAMVAALHAVGLRVGMDVVYNHVSASGQDRQSVLDRIVPGYYLRLDANGAVERSTCCANTATEHRMMAKLMSDSVLRWARDYRIDSFRFDLMGHQPRAAMVAMKARVEAAVGHPITMIGEGWNFGEVADGRRFVQASQLSLNGSGIGTFSDRARDAVRGGGPGDQGPDLVSRQGWATGLDYDRNADAPRAEPATDLMAAADQVRVGLAGSVRDLVMTTWSGQNRALRDIDYHGQPAGYASAPGEVVNYVENHDNHTLFDLAALKLPRSTQSADRARVQIVALATVAFSQGIAYFHAGSELLRSKSLDRNSYDSGDWFNRIDWTGTENYFGTGLPPARDNAASYRLIAPRLADARIAPRPSDISWTRDAFRDLLRIRRSSSLFRLRSTAEIQQRLHFYNTGPAQEPAVVVAHLEGSGLPGAGFAEVLYFINADTRTHEMTIAAEGGKAWQLHPVLSSPSAADQRVAADAQVDSLRGKFTIPPRSAVVFVVP